MVETIALNLAYVVYVASGLVNTIVRLRFVLIAASIAFIIWGAIGRIWPVVFWNAAFGGMHTYQLLRFWAQVRSISLTDQESSVHRRLFPELHIVDFYTLWSIGTQRALEPDTTVIEEDATVPTIMLIMSGEVRIEKEGLIIATSGPDDLVGERSFVTGDAASATVRTISDVTVHEWDQRKMAALVELCPAAHKSMTRFIGADLAKKL